MIFSAKQGFLLQAQQFPGHRIQRDFIPRNDSGEQSAANGGSCQQEMLFIRDQARYSNSTTISHRAKKRPYYSALLGNFTFDGGHHFRVIRLDGRSESSDHFSFFADEELLEIPANSTCMIRVRLFRG